MTSSTNDISKKLKLLNIAYDSVLDPYSFDDLLEIWDQTYLKEIFDERLDGANFGLTLEEIDQHFARALMMKPAREEIPDLLKFVDELPSPAFVLNRNGHISARNKFCETVSIVPHLGESDQLEIQEKALLAQKISAVLKKAHKDAEPVVVQIHDMNNQSYLLHMSQISFGAKSEPELAVLVRVIETIWTNNLMSILTSSFKLTDAEIETTRLLTLGKNATQIAKQRGRSLDTVRNQIKSILVKTKAQGQVELVRMLTLLSQVSPDKWHKQEKINSSQNWRFGSYTKHVIEIDGRKLEYARYGARGGPILFYVTTSSLPEETAKFRKHVEVRGFDVIAPYRPCFGQSEPAEHKNTPEGYANDCIALINELGVSELHIAGHREGGIFAAKLARRIGHGALSLTIINTGAPVRDWTILHKGSLVARRSLVTAIKAPKALELGYRLAVRIFKSGQAGENKILDVFYSGSPIDAATYQDPVLREVTRNNIAFCFQSSDDIVADIALWASDWSDDLDNLNSATKALFIHSEEHDFMLADWVRNLCRDNPRLDCKVIPLSGQTMLYTNTKKVTDLLAVQIDAGTCGKP